MTRATRELAVARAILGVTAAACGASMEPDAAQQVATARCGRELECRNIGVEGRWGSYDACVADGQEVMRDVLGGTGCARGVDPLALQDCVEATRLQTCAAPRSLRGRATAQAELVRELARSSLPFWPAIQPCTNLGHGSGLRRL